MHRCGSGLCLLMTITFAIALTGCLGSSTPNSSTGSVQNVSLNPAVNFSMDVGKSQVFSATATDANGRPVVGSTQFTVTDSARRRPAQHRSRLPATATPAPEHGTRRSPFAIPARPASRS